MSVDIEVTGLDAAISKIQDAKAALDGIGEGLLQAVDEVLVPDIEEASTVVYNVRTGAYSQGWYSFQADPYTVTVSNTVGYAVPLEYGWTTRNGGFRESEGVAIPTALESAGAVGEALATWLNSQLQ